MNIDTTFDFRTDTPPGKDPDSYSPTLRQYHKHLWSKRLPCGEIFELDDTTPGRYLHHKSNVGEFFLTSDSVIPSFAREPRIAHIIDFVMLPNFIRTTYTIGGMMIFPGNRINNKMTINGARGFNQHIKDRFDLTVECIRRYYLNQVSPLSETLERYADFFALFKDFRGYVQFFLLEDLVNEDFSAIKFFTPFDDFKTSPVPANREEYVVYRKLAVDFVKARNCRILKSG